MTKIDITDYASRMRTMCKAAIAGSKAMVGDQLAANTFPYWIMQDSVIQTLRPTHWENRTQLQFELFLARGGVDSGQKNELLITTREDMFTVIEYFDIRKNFYDGTTYTSNPNWFIPGSLRVDSIGIAEYQTDVGVILGTVYNAQWWHRTIQPQVEIL